MKKFFRTFDTHSEYEAFTGTSEFILPNVSWCRDDIETVHYNPYILLPKNIINYQASTKLEDLHKNEFSGSSGQLTIVSHIFENGVGTIEFNDNVTTIGSDAFSGCSSLTSIEIPDSVTGISYQSFYYCTSLSSINIPSGVTSIGYKAFYNCSGLTSINIPSGVTNINDETFRMCKGLTSIDIPDNVTRIGNSAFTLCNSITTCTIGNGVTSIGNDAFYSCYSLTSITVKSTTPPKVYGGAFSNTNNCPIYVPSGSVDAYKAASGWSIYASRIQAIQE